jgi:DNA-binding response OmpR family regulator
MSRLSLAPDSPAIELVIPDAELRAALADLLRVDGFATRPCEGLARAEEAQEREASAAARAPIARIVDVAIGLPDAQALLRRLAREMPPTILVVARPEHAEAARRLGIGCVQIPFGRYALARELARVRRRRS